MQQRNQWTASKGKHPKTPNQILDSINRSNGKPKSKAPTTNYNAFVSIAPSSFSKSELEGDSRACAKYDKAVELLVTGTMNRKEATTH